jgi:hypothetical protein
MPEIVLAAEGWLVLAKLTVLPKDLCYYCPGGTAAWAGWLMKCLEDVKEGC